jgi:hypothetical protein
LSALHGGNCGSDKRRGDGWETVSRHSRSGRGSDAGANLGFGKRVDVQLKDGSKTSGRITGVANDRFVVTNSKGAAKPIAYAKVSRITKQKEKLGLFHKPWVGIMFTAAGVGTLIVLGACSIRLADSHG